ncbi:MAG: MOSC N-terminal beta barrel domain-containing protein [Steroidobacteraceae bacterium]
MGHIASLHVYPVKSCRGIDVADALVTPTGLEWDRRWMLLAARDKFVTQRTHPKLATITVAVGGGRLTLSAQGHGSTSVDVEQAGESRRTRVWDDDCNGIDAGDQAASWLTQVLGEPMRLVRIDPAVPRNANPKYAGAEPQPLTFTDGYPVLMISRASLDALNRRLPAPIPMGRFRPNVVIDGVPEHAEDAMALFRLGEVVLRGVKHCARCVVTTTDQRTGVRDPDQQPLRTLNKYRHDRVLRGVTFGQNCTLHAGIGKRLAVGAELSIEPYQV